MTKTTDATREPVCYHPMPQEFYDETIHAYFVQRILDLTPTDNQLAYTALINRLGYVGICCTAEGAKLLENRLEERHKIDMADIKCPLYP